MNSYWDRGLERVPTTYNELEEIVNKYPSSLIATTACIGGEVSSQVLNLIKAEKKSISDVLIIPMVEDLSVPINIATKLRNNGIKTEIVVTTNLEEWNHIINLRYHGTTGAPHPDIKVVVEKIYRMLKKDKMVGGLVAEV
jgi:histidyl-tRNA synthetase